MGSTTSQQWAESSVAQQFATFGLSSDPPKQAQTLTTRVSNDVPLDESLALCPVNALFDDIEGQPPVAFLKSIEPLKAIGLIPKVMLKAETTHDYAKLNMKGEAVTSAKLSLEEYAAILKYVAEDSIPSFYSTMNALCYKKEQRAQLRGFVPYMWLLLHALQRLPPYPHPKVHRGVKLNLRSQFPKGREFHWWSFVSTTKSIKVLEQEIFCGKSGPRTIFSITLRQRQARDISPFSPLPEGEVLLPPGCKFRVIDAADMGNGLTIIDLQELPSKMYVMDLSSHVASEGKQKLHQHQHSSAAAAAPSAGGAKSPPAVATAAPTGAGKSAVFWYELGTWKGGGKVEGQEYSKKACYETALAINPKYAKAWNELGVMGGGRVAGQEHSKKACHETTLAIDPKCQEAWLGLGFVGGGRVAGQEYSAKDCYETALAIDPKYAWAWNGLGLNGGGQVHGKHYSKAECHALYEQYNPFLK